MAISSLGIAYRVLNRVREAVPGSPAAKAGLRGGDEIVSATILPPDADAMERLRKDFNLPELKSSRSWSSPSTTQHCDWPDLAYPLQGGLPGTTVELEWSRGKKRRRRR